MGNVLSAKNIRKSFLSPTKVDVLKGVDFELASGESIAIMGASGEGKSTLLHILGTLEEPTSGELYIAQKSVAKHPPPLLRNQHIGFVFQGFHLLESYTVLQNVLMPALIAKQPTHAGSKAHARACSLLEQVGLEKRITFQTKLLSGGEKQRVALARALCNDPDILLTDEPSGNLDHDTSSQIHRLLMESVNQMGKALIVVTHDPALARLCQKQYALVDGVLIPQAVHKEKSNGSHLS